MSLTFWILAALMLATALVAVLWPLLRSNPGRVDGALQARRRALQAARDSGVLSESEYAAKLTKLSAEVQPASAAPASRRPALLGAIAVLVGAPLLAIALYFHVGDPRALDPAALEALKTAQSANAQDMDQAISGLAARLEREPNDLQGWLLLGRAYKSTERFGDAERALRRALDLDSNNADAMVEYAEAAALASSTRRIEGEARALLEKALAANPQHQRALWLLGIADSQAGKPEAAVVWWKRLLLLLEPGSDVAASVQQQIDAALASAPADSTALAAAPVSTEVSATAQNAQVGSGPKLTVQVALADALREKVAPNDTLFVFARAKEGTRMPLAIQRRRAGELPLTLTLDDSMGMTPAFKLSSMTEVVVGARISRSGNAAPQSGDLQILSEALPVSRSEPIVLTISEIVP